MVPCVGSPACQRLGFQQLNMYGQESTLWHLHFLLELCFMLQLSQQNYSASALHPYYSLEGFPLIFVHLSNVLLTGLVIAKPNLSRQSLGRDQHTLIVY